MFDSLELLSQLKLQDPAACGQIDTHQPERLNTALGKHCAIFFENAHVPHAASDWLTYSKTAQHFLGFIYA